MKEDDVVQISLLLHIVQHEYGALRGAIGSVGREVHVYGQDTPSASMDGCAQRDQTVRGEQRSGGVSAYQNWGRCTILKGRILLACAKSGRLHSNVIFAVWRNLSSNASAASTQTTLFQRQSRNLNAVNYIQFCSSTVL